MKVQQELMRHADIIRTTMNLSRFVVRRISIVNYIFFRHVPSAGVLLGGTFIVAGAAIIYFWK